MISRRFGPAISILLLLAPSPIRMAEGAPPQETRELGAVTIYDAATGPANGWSHIVTHPEAFPLIARPVSRYAVDSSSLVVDGDCEGQRVFRTILVKKTSDWQQQHANGIEPTFFDSPQRVGDVRSLRLRLKLNSAETKIPTVGELADTYGSFLTKEQIDELDRGLPCLGLTFVEAGFNERETETLNAVYYISFDPAKDFDRWMELTIPLGKFEFGFEKNYAVRPVERKDVLDREFVAFRINPETSSGKVARSFLSERWDGSVPELYKELSISLCKIAVDTSDSEE